MTYQPTAQTLLHASAGRYEAFPVAASDPSGTVLGLWRSATQHWQDKAATIRAVKSTNQGVSYTSLGSVFDDGDPLKESGASGLVWNPRRGKWQALLLVKRFAAAGDTTPAEYQARMIESADGVTWVSRGPLVIPKPSWVSWWFAASLVIHDEGITALFYGATTGASKWEIFPVTSKDDGATWAGTKENTIRVAGVNLSEPQMTQLQDGSWLISIRGDDNQIYTATATNPASWSVSSVVPVLQGYSGQPSIIATGDSVLMLLRQLPSGVGGHGLWAFAESLDNGVTWAVRDTFPEKTRNMMYGGLAALPNGDVACVYASEDNPSTQYGPCSVYATRFVLLRLTAELVYEYASPAVRVTLPVTATVLRSWFDEWTGEEVIEQVRLQEPTDTAGTVAVDPEIVPGTVYTYQAAGAVSPPIEVPQFADAYLVHPLEPDWSLPVVIGEIGDRSYDTNTTVTQVAFRDHPVTQASGFLGAAEGEFTLTTYTLMDKRRLLRLLQGNTPLFLSTHVGLDLPEWVKLVGSVKETKVVQMCSHNLDDPTDPAQRVGWSLSYVEQPRPTATELPRRKRIRDYKQPIDTINIEIQST